VREEVKIITDEGSISFEVDLNANSDQCKKTKL